MHRIAILIALLGLIGPACADEITDRDLPASEIVHHGIGDIVPSCETCHGAQGKGDARAAYPRLAGQRAAYLSAQLDAFADGTRKNGVMQAVATALSEPERQQLAAYFANLPVPAASALRTTPTAAVMARGEQLALHGDDRLHVPACVLCHGESGVGVGGSFPSLADQSADYLARQMRGWKSGLRPPGPLGLMSSVANRLGDDDIDAVSLYFSHLVPQAAKEQP